MFAAGGQHAKACADQGFDMISVLVDYTTLGAAVNNQVDIAKGGEPKVASGASY